MLPSLIFSCLLPLQMPQVLSLFSCLAVYQGCPRRPKTSVCVCASAPWLLEVAPRPHMRTPLGGQEGLRGLQRRTKKAEKGPQEFKTDQWKKNLVFEHVLLVAYFAPEMPQDGLKLTPRSLKIAPILPQTRWPKGPQDAMSIAQDDSKSTPICFQESPTWPPEAPGSPQ